MKARDVWRRMGGQLWLFTSQISSKVFSRTTKKIRVSPFLVTICRYFSDRRAGISARETQSQWKSTSVIASPSHCLQIQFHGCCLMSPCILRASLSPRTCRSNSIAGSSVLRMVSAGISLPTQGSPRSKQGLLPLDRPSFLVKWFKLEVLEGDFHNNLCVQGIRKDDLPS